MRRRPRTPDSPLPQRDGIDPVHLRLPVPPADDGGRPTLRDWLAERLPLTGPTLDAMLAAGEFVGEQGPFAPDTPYSPGAHVWFHRERLPEQPVPFPVEVLYRDERIVVADKPHFLATTPRGRHVTETALARLRHDLGLPRLSPAHRLDRLTAGVVLFVADPALRAAYQGLFRERAVRKTYLAVAGHRPELDAALPLTVHSHIVKVRGEMAARELPDRPPNAETLVEPDGRRGTLARYRLTPATGRTHQLRLHLSTLGIPILNDPVYPRVLPDGDPADFADPLQLLAAELEFTDPVTGVRHRFRSRRTLSVWPEQG